MAGVTLSTALMISSGEEAMTGNGKTSAKDKKKQLNILSICFISTLQKWLKCVSMVLAVFHGVFLTNPSWSCSAHSLQQRGLAGLPESTTCVVDSGGASLRRTESLT
jgi:hypothetical protein